jgi:threonine aldolase
VGHCLWAAISKVARQHELPVHMDGARFANALVHLRCSPAEATWKCGVDVLSLGATKNGALGADAVVFFDPAMARDFERRRKRAGHLMSKLRFVSAQLIAYLKNGLWLENARHANAMALRMAEGLKRVVGAKLLHPVEANEVFVALPEETVRSLESQGFDFYRWPLRAAEAGATIRLVTCFATLSADVDEFVAAATAAAIKPRG